MSEKIHIILLMSLLLTISGCSKSEINEKEAQEVLSNFYADNVPESINDRHLLRAGKALVPYLIVEIQKRDMPKREYAILALGKMRDNRGLPVLKKILEDSSDVLGARECALRAIWYIDRTLGEEYMSKYAGESQEMDRIIHLLKEGKI